MKARVDYLLVSLGLLAGLSLGAGQFGGAIVLAVAAVGGAKLWRECF
ncbi:MAG: hypothetical protein LBI92_05505 [Azoarcus sp.]|jgi:hypothetical protein|nr:hypothetical protein [Azoarcus sp.]